MRAFDLAEKILSAKEMTELTKSIDLLENENYKTFYNLNKETVNYILFTETYDDFLDVMEEYGLDIECFIFAFLCENKYGIQVGGYTEDLEDEFSVFIKEKNIDYLDIKSHIAGDTFYTDGGNKDTFKESIINFNKILDTHNLRFVVFEDDVYCECLYTVLLLQKNIANDIFDIWESENFKIYL